jgi:hypothetical protein
MTTEECLEQLDKERSADAQRRRDDEFRRAMRYERELGKRVALIYIETGLMYAEKYGYITEHELRRIRTRIEKDTRQ